MGSPPNFVYSALCIASKPSHPRAYQEPQRCLGPAAPVAQLEWGRGLRKPPRVPLPPSPFPFPAPSAAAQTSWSQAALPGIYSSFLPLLAGRPGTGLLSPASSPRSQPTAGRRRSVGPRLSPAAPPPWPGVPGSRCWDTAPGDGVDGAGCCPQHPSLLGRLCRVPGTSRPHVAPPGTSISHPMLSVCTHGCSLCTHSPSYWGCGAEFSPWHKGKVPGVSQAVFEEGGITPNPTSRAAGMEPSPSPMDGWLTLEPGGFFPVPHKPKGPHSRGKVAQTERSRAAAAGPRCSRSRRAPGAAQALALLPAPCRARALPSSGLCPAYRPGRAGVTPLSPLRAFPLPVAPQGAPWRAPSSLPRSCCPQLRGQKQGARRQRAMRRARLGDQTHPKTTEAERG